ncbi:helix-turn-helix domain-containing protein [Blastococcus sp. CT_GayMR16]|uniref:helix-turn-helix domain-containing protein n=1 Tax=Blastococcus sp. CT_GayMR16 TaxID=2559607 RepID=UPI0010744F69|nr:helix-turn-helix domain-containing protein [Blastococcus sp. CT_GayMR16]TFV83143.1 DNA-binding protein [Blastococcus sp. CT_GayMR16]
MTDYNARIELDSRDFDEAAVDVLMDVVEPYSGVVARAVHGGRVELILTVPAADLRQATITAMSIVLATGHQVYALEVLPTDDFHQRINATPVPELLSVTQTADELGISRQRALQLVNAGQLDAVKVGDTWVVPRPAVTARVAEVADRRQRVEAALLADGEKSRAVLATHRRQQEKVNAAMRTAGVEVTSYP